MPDYFDDFVAFKDSDYPSRNVCQLTVSADNGDKLTVSLDFNGNSLALFRDSGNSDSEMITEEVFPTEMMMQGDVCFSITNIIKALEFVQREQ